MKSLRQQLIPFLFLLSVIALDQLTKQWALSFLRQGYFMPVLEGFFNLTLHFNPGVAFGMFADWPEPSRTIVLSVAKLGALSLCFWLLRKQYANSMSGQIALGMIIGGALGNIIDRAVHGQVIDFLDFYYGEYHWPTFNVADSAICLGVAMLLLIKDPKRVEAVPSSPIGNE